MIDPTVHVGSDDEPRSEDELNAEGLLSTRQMSILTGVAIDEIRAELARQRKRQRRPGRELAFRMPAAWLRRAHERRRLAAADDLGEALVILAALDEIAALPETP